VHFLIKTSRPLIPSSVFVSIFQFDFFRFASPYAVRTVISNHLQG
jgi:hypothetical protein